MLNRRKIKLAIQMRVNKNKESKCTLCNTPYMRTPEMYDLRLSNNRKNVIFVLCKKCVDELFQKTLKANCLYNGKLKTKEDMKRIMLSKEREIENG